MITVHHLNNSRSQRILWFLEELGIEYQIEFYQRDAKTNLAPAELSQIHPLGKSPVITDSNNSITVAESGAILDYLAREYGSHFLPEVNTQAYRDCQYWLHFAEGSLMPMLLIKLMFDKVKTAPVPFILKPVTKGIADKAMAAYAGPNIKRMLTYIDDYLNDKQYFADSKLTIADIQMSFPLEASIQHLKGTDVYPHIQQYVKRLQSRPSYKSALKKGGQYDYAT